ncbi:antibiotic biosynthesis monooxygenase family protein [Corallibacter sp.]|uniref:antibiotic biosynthesis monooxygenase family protein n=1 Tax=Corallibacter sp. TaxID=2038084 RepID=UPI003AB880C9
MKKDFTPYYAVIFSSTQTENTNGYLEMSNKMSSLAKVQDGFLGIESARNKIGITVSYWRDLESISQWKQNTEHILAQQKGQEIWYDWYRVRICKVVNDYEFLHK